MSDFNEQQQDFFKGFAKKTDRDEEEERRRKAGMAALGQRLKDYLSGPSATERFTRSIQGYKDNSDKE